MSATAAPLTQADCARILAGSFAPWVQDLGLVFDAVTPGEVTTRVPFSLRLNRQGGTVCGQAMMALADTSMVFAIVALLGEFAPMTTVAQNTTFLRPAANADLLCVARVIRRGRTMIYGEAYLYAGAADKPVAHATSTYMML